MRTLAQMTKEELEDIIESAVEHKLLELIGDPDEGLVVKKQIRNRLLRQKQAVIRGERGKPLEEVIKELGLE